MTPRSSALPRQTQEADGSPSAAGDLPRYPQGVPLHRRRGCDGCTGGVHHQPPSAGDAVPRHPQGGGGQALHTRGSGCALSSEQEPSDGATDAGEQRCRDGSRCARRGDDAPVPDAGVLRPLARALLAVASDVHAARRNPLEAGRSTPGAGVRMRHGGDPLGGRLGGRLRGPMWRHSERTGAAVASAPVKCAFPPPVVNPDCQRLAHTVGTNEVFARLIGAARSRPGAELVTWWGERYCAGVLGEVVRPDGLGVWREEGASVTFCLEYDRGTESLARLGAKAADYARLESAWGVAFWLLVVVPGPRRESGARAALAGHGLAVATTTASGARRPDAANWAPLEPEVSRLRLAELADWPRPAASAARLAHSARSEATGQSGYEAR